MKLGIRLSAMALSGILGIAAGAAAEPSAAQRKVDARAATKAIDQKIEAAKKDVEDNQSEVQFQIQLGTSDLQNAENVRSQAERRRQ